MVGCVRHEDQSAKAQLCILEFDLRVPVCERFNVDYPAGAHHIELHQINQRRTAGEKLRGILDRSGGSSRATAAAATDRIGSITRRR